MATKNARPFDREVRHEVVKHPQKFIRFKDGPKLYCICQTKFEKLAWDANAVYKVEKVCLVNIEIFEEYLETFRVVKGRDYYV